MRVLIIDEKVKRELNELSAYAEENPFSMDDLLDIKNGAKRPAGEREGHVLKLSQGYRLVYSIEQQPIGKVRHMSLSVDAVNRLPNPASIREIMPLLGYKFELGHENCRAWVEDISETYSAVNVMELIL